VFAFFPSEEQIPARGAIAGSLRGFVCQKLVPKIDGYGRLPVIEILTVDATVKKLIVEGQFEKIQGLLAGRSDSASG
jgi:twitching motility protein PilT